MNEPASIDNFQPLVGRRIYLKDTLVILMLDRVDPGPPAPPPLRPPFSLILSGPKPGPVAPEGPYECQVEGGSSFDLYLSPIHTPAPDRQDYQVVFN